MIFSFDATYTTTYTINTLRRECIKQCSKCKHSKLCVNIFCGYCPIDKEIIRQVDKAIEEYKPDDHYRRYIALNVEVFILNDKFIDIAAVDMLKRKCPVQCKGCIYGVKCLEIFGGLYPISNNSQELIDNAITKYVHSTVPRQLVTIKGLNNGSI